MLYQFKVWRRKKHKCERCATIKHNLQRNTFTENSNWATGTDKRDNDGKSAAMGCWGRLVPAQLAVTSLASVMLSGRRRLDRHRDERRRLEVGSALCQGCSASLHECYDQDTRGRKPAPIFASQNWNWFSTSFILVPKTNFPAPIYGLPSWQGSTV